MPAHHASRILPALLTLTMLVFLVACGGGGASPVGGGPGATGPRVPSSPAGVGSTAVWTYTATGTVDGNGQHFDLTGTRTIAGDITWAGVLNGDRLHVIDDDQSLRVAQTGQTFSLSAEYYDHFSEEGTQYRYGIRVGGGSVEWLGQRVLVAEASMSVGDTYGPLTFTDSSGTQHTSSIRVDGVQSVQSALGTLSAYRLHTTGTISPVGGPVSHVDVVTFQRPDVGILQQTETITQSLGGQTAVQKVTWKVETYQSHGRSHGAPSGVGAPDVALFFVSGHRLSIGPGSFIFDGKPEPDYLSRFGDGGPYIHQSLEGDGYDVHSFFYSDNDRNIPQGSGNIGPGPGYPQLISDLTRAASAYGPSTQIVVIAHSHGGVSAHAALRDLDVALGSNRVLLVDLDTNQLQFDTLHGCGAWGGCDGEILNVEVGIHNVVHACVEANLEIRSTTPVVKDTLANRRTPSGSTAGIESHPSVDSHSDCHRPSSPAMDLVLSFLRQKLSD